MAKHNGLLRHTSGTLIDGIHVRETENGTVLARNPRRTGRRSEAQADMRCQMGNLGANFRLFDHRITNAFADKAPGQNDYNIYIQVNYGIHPVYITKQESKCGGCVLGNYQYSRGNLDPIGIAVNANGVLATNLGLGGLTIDADTTVADFSQAIMQNNRGYEALDQITFFYGEQSVDSEGVPRATMASERVVLSLTDQTKLWDVTSALGFSTVSGCLGMNTALSNAGGSWIHSRDLDDGSTQVSTQRMTVVSDILSHYQSDEAFLASANSYGGINKKSIYLSPSSNV